MASKRQIKKAIRNACGDIAGECIFAESAFGENKIEEWDSIIIDTALLQEEAVNRAILGMILEKDYGSKLQSPAEGKEIFKSIRTMAEYIQAHRTK